MPPWFHAVRWWGWLWRVLYGSQLCIWSSSSNHSRSANCCMYTWCYFKLTTKAVFVPHSDAQHLNFIHKMYDSYLYKSLWQDWSPVAKKSVNNLEQQQTDCVTATMNLVILFLNEPQSSFNCTFMHCLLLLQVQMSGMTSLALYLMSICRLTCVAMR